MKHKNCKSCAHWGSLGKHSEFEETETYKVCSVPVHADLKRDGDVPLMMTLDAEHMHAELITHKDHSCGSFNPS